MALERVNHASLRYSYDPYTDVLTVEGHKYSGALFRGFAYLAVGTTVRIINREDGLVTLETVRTENTGGNDEPEEGNSEAEGQEEERPGPV